ncbi:hypothetical protein [Trinickia acidisoli]|uniref:hypothetical protein n=1 Tax=Trinickia acidisoli TaxID=2767482 RepID=UPI001A8D64D1|nr:hypothetical protein [Trinickia acidisoli]
MKGFRYVIASIVMGVVSTTSCYANPAATQQTAADANECTVVADRSAAAPKPPVLSIGVSDPNTKLNLPWFLTDFVNAVNTHQSAHCLLHALRSGI